MARYDPFEEMDRMFEQLRARTWTPEGRLGPDFRAFGRGDAVNVDLTEHGDEYVLVADLPGFEREEIDLTFEDGVLALVAENETREERTTDEGDEPAVAGNLARSRRASERVTVPGDVVEDDITASYRNGVLEVHLPLVDGEAGEDDDAKIDIAD